MGTEYKHTPTAWAEAFSIFANHDTGETALPVSLIGSDTIRVSANRDDFTLYEIERLEYLGWAWRDDINGFRYHVHFA